MKITGLLLMPSGWFIILAALVLLRTFFMQNVFIFAGIGVEILGLVLLTRGHLTVKGGNE